MAELTNEQKKAWAKTLYTRETLTQAEIAERVGVSRVTVNNWIGKGNWEQLKASITITREEQLKNLYRQLAELNNAIMGKPEGERFPNAAEADTISKLSNAIKKLETEVGLADIISVFSDLLKWVRTYDSTQAKEITRFWTRLSNQNYPDMAKKRLTPQDRIALDNWNELVASVREHSDINPTDTETEIRQRRERLEKNDEEWFKYYFAMYCTCESAAFHKKATGRLMRNNRWYEVRAWSRELAKSARSMMEISKLALTKKIRNVLLISNSADNAERLLLPFMANFEENQRIIQDYGQQKKPGAWETGEFTCMSGCSFRAIGAGQSPRGTRNKNFRPDFILVDDIDTDEECRNPERIKTKWKWLEEALIPTMSVSGNYRILFNGNIIAPDCCIKRAIEKATELKAKGIGHVDIINIRGKDGLSVWPEKNSEEDIDLFLSLVSAAAAQKEFFNNPVVDGGVFAEITYGKVPALSKFKFLVIYGDPAPGENKTKKSSTKTVCLLGKLAGRLYLIKTFLDRGLNAEFVEWYIKLLEFVGGKTTVYCYMENNKLQDPFFQQVFQPIVRRIRRERKISLYITGDEEKKTDKATRIEANLEPLNREGNLVLNEAEKDNPHMKRMAEQFKLFNLQLTYPADGPDCVEGGNRIIDRKARQSEKPVIVTRKSTRSQNKYRV